MKGETKAILVVLAALWATVALLVVAVDARAGDYGPGRPFGPPELVALGQAEAFWGRQPDLCTSRTLEVVARGALGAGVAGRATRPSEPQPCVMYLEEGVVTDELGLCSVVRHEYGHWLGFSDEDPELARLPGCGPALDLFTTARRQAWGEWRELRAECREARGPYRQCCWHKLRRRGAQLRSMYL